MHRRAQRRVCLISALSSQHLLTQTSARCSGITALPRININGDAVTASKDDGDKRGAITALWRGTA